MKTRKFISAILCITLFSAILCIPVAAQNNLPTSSGEALFSYIGITLPEYRGAEDPMRRGDFLSMLMQIFKLQKNPDSHALPFNDIDPASELGMYAASALNTGIISPSSAFEPLREVKLAEAAKMAVTALGYAPEAASLGGYPGGYLAKAERLSLFKGTARADALSYGDALKFLINVCDTDLNHITSIGKKTTYTVTEGENALTLYHGIRKETGIIEANEHTSLYDSDVLSKKGSVMLNNKNFRYNGEYMLGENVTAYITDDPVAEIVYLSSKNNTAAEITYTDFSGATNSEITAVDKNGKTLKYPLSSSPAIIYNGKASRKINKPSDISIDSGSIVILDNNRDGRYDVIFVNDYKSFYVGAVNRQNGKIFDKNTPKALCLEDFDDYKIYLNGTEADFASIDAGLVLDCLISEDGRYAEIHACDAVAEGVCTEYSISGKKITLGETAYNLSDYFCSHYSENISASSPVTLHLNRFGEAAAVTEGSGNMKYGYVIAKKTSKSLSASEQVKICTQNGSVAVYSLADRVIVDDMPVMNHEKAYAYIETDQLIKFNLDSEGKLKIIDTPYSKSDRVSGAHEPETGVLADNAPSADRLIRYSFPNEDSTDTLYFKNNTIHPFFALPSQCVIFCVDKTLPTDDARYCTVSTRAMFKTDEKISSDSVRPYCVTSDGCAEAMVFYTVARSTSQSSSIALVKSVTRAVTPEGIQGIKVTLAVLGSGKFASYYMTDRDVYKDLYAEDANEANGDMPLSAGDIVRYVSDTNNNITGIVLDYDFSLNKKLNYFGGSYNTLLNYYMGYLYDYDKSTSFFMISKTDDKSAIAAADKYCIFSYSNFFCFDSEAGEVYPVEITEFTPYLHDNDAPDRILFVSRWATGLGIVIYK